MNKITDYEIVKILAESLRKSSTESTFKPDDIEQRRIRCEKLCEKENAIEGKRHLADGFHCALCKNKGYRMEARERDGWYEAVQITCKCEKSRRSIRNLKASGLENVLKLYTFEGYKVTEKWQEIMKNTAKAFLRQDNVKCLFMGGNSGSGKTHLCSAVAIDYLRHGREVKYMLWRAEARHIKEDNSNGGRLIERYKNIEVLYIDDLFKTGRARGDTSQMPTQGDVNIAIEIIDERQRKGLITIISSENTIEELIDIDEGLGGRIKRYSEGFHVTIDKDRGKNYRLID